MKYKMTIQIRTMSNQSWILLDKCPSKLKVLFCTLHSKNSILSITSKKLKACANLFLQSDEPRDEGETFDPDVTAQGLRGGQLQTELDEGQEVWRDHTYITLDQLVKKFHGFARLFLQDNQRVCSN